MLRSIILAILLAVSLCADCFAVSLCSGVTMGNVRRRQVLTIALVFGFVQAGLLLLGYLFGDLFVGYVEKFAHWIGFLLLLYVGGSMILEAVKHGVCKVNIDTDLRMAMTASIRQHFAEHPDHFDPRQYLKPAREAMKQMYIHKIVNVLGSDGKA